MSIGVAGRTVARYFGRAHHGAIRAAATVIGVVGTLLGVALGVPLALNVEQIAPRLESLLGVDILPADVYYIASMPSDLRVPDVVRVTLLAFGLCALATLYPSWRAARTQPAEALRYDH